MFYYKGSYETGSIRKSRESARGFIHPATVPNGTMARSRKAPTGSGDRKAPEVLPWCGFPNRQPYPLGFFLLDFNSLLPYPIMPIPMTNATRPPNATAPPSNNPKRAAQPPPMQTNTPMTMLKYAKKEFSIVRPARCLRLIAPFRTQPALEPACPGKTGCRYRRV